MAKPPSGYTEEQWRAEIDKAAETRRLRAAGVISDNETVDDVSDLFPKARTHAEIWRNFHESAQRNGAVAATARRKAGVGA